MNHPDAIAPLRLHFPTADVRPGEKPDFTHFAVPKAGEVRRPAIDAPAEAMRDLAFEMIRVLDDSGRALGPWADMPDVTGEMCLEGLRHMLTLRAYDARMLLAQRQQKTSFYIQHLGEEAISCAFQRALRPGDMNFPTYRQAGLLIAAGYPIEKMMCQVYGNDGDPVRGRQLPVLYSAKKYGFFSISGNLGTQYIQAVGWAMGSAIAKDDKIAAAWIGDGSTAESDFHAAMIFASTYGAPVILNIVNNQWAISTYQSVARGGASTFASRGHGFGIPALRVDGNDYLAVLAAARWAAARARLNFGPTLIEYVTYRAGGHSTSDDPAAYRPLDEGASWPLGDPIERLKGHLIARGLWSQERHAQTEASIIADIVARQKEVEAIGTLHAGRRPSPAEMFEDVYAEMPAHLRRQRQWAGF